MLSPRNLSKWFPKLGRVAILRDDMDLTLSNVVYSWATSRSLGSVADLERMVGYVNPLSVDYLRELLRYRDRTLITAKLGDQVVGYVIWTKYPNRRFALERLTVHPSLRRRGIGGGLLGKVMDRLLGWQSYCECYLPEDMLPGIFFLRSKEFRAIRIMRYEDRDVYHFIYTLYKKVPLDDCEVGDTYYFRYASGRCWEGEFLGIDRYRIRVRCKDGNVQLQGKHISDIYGNRI